MEPFQFANTVLDFHFPASLSKLNFFNRVSVSPQVTNGIPFFQYNFLFKNQLSIIQELKWDG